MLRDLCMQRVFDGRYGSTPWLRVEILVFRKEVHNFYWFIGRCYAHAHPALGRYPRPTRCLHTYMYADVPALALGNARHCGAFIRSPPRSIAALQEVTDTGRQSAPLAHMWPTVRSKDQRTRPCHTAVRDHGSPTRGPVPNAQSASHAVRDRAV